MDVNNLILIGKEFVNSQPYIALGIVIFVLVFIYFKPKAAFRSLVGVGLIVLAIYLLASLSGTLNSGAVSRDTLLDIDGKANQEARD